MGIVLVGLSHSTAPVTTREQAAFSRDELHHALEQLAASQEISEALILSTCNRVEIVAEADNEQQGIAAVRDFLHRFHGLASGELNPFLYALESAVAVRHVFRVACGLDSIVIGESQILGQMRDAYHAARQVGSIGPSLNRMMRHTFHVARKVRSDVGDRLAGRSVSEAAVELARQILGDLQDRTVLVVGAGKMSELTASHLHRAGARQVLVTNRTYDRAAQLAARFHGEPIAFEDLEQALVRSDIVISSAANPSGYVIRHAAVERALRHRPGRPLLFIDIAVPRNVEPSVSRLENTHLCDIDELAGSARSDLSGTASAVRFAEQMVEAAAEAFDNRTGESEIGFLIATLRSRVESIGCAELDRHMSKLTIASPQDREWLALMVRRIGNKFLHPLIVQLKRQARSSESKADYVESLTLAFNATGGDRMEAAGCGMSSTGDSIQ